MSITLQTPLPLFRGLNRLRLGRDLPLVPLLILVPFVLIAVFANVIAPYDPTEPIAGAKIFEPPVWVVGGSTHALLGTDYQARDVLSRLIFGARVSLIVGVMGTLVAGSIGTTLGMLAGYIGGWVDQLIMRVTDAWLALPAIVRDLPRHHGRTQHVEHRHHPGQRLLDTLRQGDPR
jgi:peptide/nickel transport system permease protein